LVGDVNANMSRLRRMQVGDLVKVDPIGAGLVTDVYWDDEEGSEFVRIRFMDGTWSLENEDIVEVVNASR
jgi:hypothetical protein